MAQDTDKIVAILFSDVVGYAHVTDPDRTAPIVHDEETRNVIRAVTQRHKGDWVQEIGDAVVCTFSSAVAATQCALEIQQVIVEEFEFRPRIGIHVGDLTTGAADAGKDVFGDAVNVATRVQALSERGGICITGRAHEELRSNQAFLDFEDMGDVSLEGVSAPVKVYRVSLPEKPVTLSEFATERERSDEKRSRVPVIVVSCAVLLALAIGWLLARSAPEGTAHVVEVGTEVETARPEPVAEAVPESASSPQVPEEDLRVADFAAVRDRLLGLEGKSDFRPGVWTIPDPVKDNAVYRVGIEADCSCTALLFAIDGSADAISLLYPNPFHLDASMQAGEVLKIPSSGEWIMRAVGGEGIDTMTLIVVDGSIEFGVADEIWSATPDQPERVAELEALLAKIETLDWDAVSAPLQIIP